jgi:dUTP pyrophosphatase
MTHHIKVRITRLSQPMKGQDVPLPSYATEGSAGMDIYAAVDTETIIPPGETALIPAGFSIELPPGFEGQVRPRSGLAIKHGIGILNAPGTIDSDYRGEVKVILSNFSKNPFTIRRGDRIAQLVIASFSRVEWVEVEQLESTDRGAGGFGHTGQ